MSGVCNYPQASVTPELPRLAANCSDVLACVLLFYYLLLFLLPLRLTWPTTALNELLPLLSWCPTTDFHQWSLNGQTCNFPVDLVWKPTQIHSGDSEMEARLLYGWGVKRSKGWRRSGLFFHYVVSTSIFCLNISHLSKINGSLLDLWMLLKLVGFKG